MSIVPGVQIGGYEVREALGRGAMGVVYRAYHQGLARPAAVKVLQALEPDADTAARFRREAQSIAQMRHPNILNVFDFGESGGVPYMIVEYVPGGSLADRLRAGPPPDRDLAVGVLRGIATGLDYAHSLGVVHRDVKPANVLMGKDGTPILADFGLAKLLESSSVKSLTGMTTGTPAYMSPEQAMGGSVGPGADRYALACVAYQLLTGKLPFNDAGVVELLYAHVHREPAPPSTWDPTLGAAVDGVVVKGLAKRPEDRWQTCTEMVDALAEALACSRATAVEATIPVPPAPVAEPAAGSEPRPPSPGPAIAPAAPAAPAPTGPAPRRGHRLRWAAGAVVALLVVAAVGLFMFTGVANNPLAAAPLIGGPSMTVSDSTVPAGETVTVTASHLSPNQAGVVRIASTPKEIATFQADANGLVVASVTIPRDSTGGEHTLSLCWGGSCHASAKVVVLAALPPPIPTTPSPGATPSKYHPVISQVYPNPVRLKGPVTIQASGFNPDAKGVVVALIQLGHDGETLFTLEKPINADGSLSVSGNVGAFNFVAGSAYFRVCTFGGAETVCADAPVTLSK